MASKAGFLQVLESNLMVALPGTDLRGTPHIESKIKTWKKHYNCLGDMLNTSGFGWNDTMKTIEVESDDVWETYVKVKYYKFFIAFMTMLYIFLVTFYLFAA